MLCLDPLPSVKGRIESQVKCRWSATGNVSHGAGHAHQRVWTRYGDDNRLEVSIHQASSRVKTATQSASLNICSFVGRFECLWLRKQISVSYLNGFAGAIDGTVARDAPTFYHEVGVQALVTIADGNQPERVHICLRDGHTCITLIGSRRRRDLLLDITKSIAGQRMQYRR